MCWKILRLHQAAEECVLAKKGECMFFGSLNVLDPVCAFVGATGERQRCTIGNVHECMYAPTTEDYRTSNKASGPEAKSSPPKVDVHHNGTHSSNGSRKAQNRTSPWVPKASPNSVLIGPIGV